MAVGITTNNVGVSLQSIITDLVLSAETLQKGLLAVHANMNADDIFIPLMTTDADPIGAVVATPTTDTATTTYSEKQLTQSSMMVYHEFNPNAWKAVWPQFYPNPRYVDSSLDIEVQNAIVQTHLQQIGNQLDRLIWQGNAGGGGALDYMDGLLKLLDADGTVNTVTPQGALTAANIIGILEDVVAAIPPAVREQREVRIVMRHSAKYLYQEAARALDYKGSDITGRISDVFGGFPIESVVGMPADRIVAYVVNGPNASCHYGTWLTDDWTSLKIERLQANSELWFLKALFQAGVQFTFGKEITTYAPA
jgi:hypothetical protein